VHYIDKSTAIVEIRRLQCKFGSNYKVVMNLHFHFHRKHSKFGLYGAALLAISLLSGCASEPPLLREPQTQVYRSPRHHNYRHQQAYNRPYRVKGKVYYPMTSASGYSETGMASWYGSESGSKTSMGSRFWPEGVSAAHKTLPLPSKVRVTNLHNGRSVVLVVNDRGPFKRNRIIDLSRGAARKIGLRGLARVKVDYIGRAN
jgi:rare lipoprotein A